MVRHPAAPSPPSSLLGTGYKSRRRTEATKRLKGRDLPNEIIFRNLKYWEIKIVVCPGFSNQNLCQIKVLLVDITPGDFYGRTGRCLRVKGMRGETALRLFPSYNNEMKMSLPRSVGPRSLGARARTVVDRWERRRGEFRRLSKS